MDKRVAIVTGGNRGIGLEICRQLAARGDMRVVLASRDVSKGEKAIKTFKNHLDNVDSLALDVADGRSIEKFAAEMAGRYGRCDVLINNAGVMLDPRGSRVLDSKEKTWHDTLAVNVFGPLLLVQALVPLMKKNGYGRIVN